MITGAAVVSGAVMPAALGRGFHAVLDVDPLIFCRARGTSIVARATQLSKADVNTDVVERIGPTQSGFDAQQLAIEHDILAAREYVNLDFRA